MLGLIHESIYQMVVRNYSYEMWLKILKEANLQEKSEKILNHYYHDRITYDIVNIISNLANIPKDQLWESFGTFFVGYVMEVGWDELLRSFSPTLRGFLENLNSLHYFIDHFVYKADLRGPTFRCERGDDDSIIFHYFTYRLGIFPIVKGIIKEIAKRIYNIEIQISVLAKTQKAVQMLNEEKTQEHLIFAIKITDNTHDNNNGHPAFSLSPRNSIMDGGDLKLSQQDFCSAFPYHIVIDRDCKMVQIGNSMCQHISTNLITPGTPLVRIFEICTPQVIFDFESICNFINSIFVFQIRQSSDLTRNSNDKLSFKGQMHLLDDNEHLIFICSPHITNIPEMLQHKMRISSWPIYDMTRELILLNQQRLTDVEVNTQLEKNNEELEKLMLDLQEEKNKTEILLKEMLPPQIADKMINNVEIETQEYNMATVMISDIPSFQATVHDCQANDVVDILNEIHVKFERLTSFHGVHKVEALGDSFITISGIPEFSDDHCEKMCHVALGMLWEAQTILDPISKKSFTIRMGIHCGPVVAGVISIKMPRFCCFGSTITTASKMEIYCPPDRILCTENAFKTAEITGKFNFVINRPIQIKEYGTIMTYFLNKSFKKSIWEIIQRERDENINSIDGYAELLKGIDENGIQEKNPVSKSCQIL